MKTFLLLMLVPLSLSAQIQNFETSYTLLSSPGINILNPVFYKGTEPLPQFGSSAERLMLHERGNGNVRNISAVRMVFGVVTGSVSLTSDSLFNTNAALAHTVNFPTIKSALAIFETRSQGSEKLRYSFFDGTNWTPPIHIPTDTSQCFSPSATHMGQDTSRIYLVAYQKQDGIFTRRYEAGAWGREFRVSPQVPLRQFTSPKVISLRNWQPLRAIVTLNYDSSGVSRVMYAYVTSHSVDSLRVDSYAYIQEPGNIKVCGLSRGFSSEPVINFDCEKGGKWKFYTASAEPPSPLLLNPQDSFPGHNYGGSGTAIAIITSDYSPYAASGWLNKSGDSLWSSVRHFQFSAKRFRISSNVQNPAIAVSPLFNGDFFYSQRVIIVWNDIENGYYVLKASSGQFELSGVENNSQSAEQFILHQNYPNPFNPSTAIRFDIRASAFVSLTVYDALGREVTVLADEYLRAGSYERVFEAAGLSSGVYFYTLRAGDFEETLRMVVVR